MSIRQKLVSNSRSAAKQRHWQPVRIKHSCKLYQCNQMGLKNPNNVEAEVVSSKQPNIGTQLILSRALNIVWRCPIVCTPYSHSLPHTHTHTHTHTHYNTQKWQEGERFSECNSATNRKHKSDFALLQGGRQLLQSCSSHTAPHTRTHSAAFQAKSSGGREKWEGKQGCVCQLEIMTDSTFDISAHKCIFMQEQSTYQRHRDEIKGWEVSSQRQVSRLHPIDRSPSAVLLIAQHM